MLAPSPVVKKTAKHSLSENFLQSAVICSSFLFIFFIGELSASLVSFFAGVLGYLVALFTIVLFAIFPLFLGVLYFFRRLIWEEKDNVLIIFKYFSSISQYKRALRFSCLIFAKLIVYSLLVFSPCIVVWLLSSDFFYDALKLSLPVWAANLWTLNSLLAVIAVLALVFIMLKYYLSAFIFVSNDEIDPAEAINMSSIISKRTGGDFFGLTLSFSGWILLSCFIAPLIFTMPYFLTSYCVHCRFAITAYNRDVDYFNAINTPFYSTDGL